MPTKEELINEIKNIGDFTDQKHYIRLCKEIDIYRCSPKSDDSKEVLNAWNYLKGINNKI